MATIPTLRRRSDFRRLYSRGRRFRDPLMTMVALSDEELDGLRLAYVVSRKVGKATVRNLLRRRLREICRLAGLRSNAAAHVALIAHPPAATAPYRELERAVLQLARRAGLLPKEAQ